MLIILYLLNIFFKYFKIMPLFQYTFTSSYTAYGGNGETETVLIKM